jgi:hypothetical protein
MTPSVISPYTQLNTEEQKWLDAISYLHYFSTMEPNQVQQNKNVLVYLRLRPLNKFEKNKRSRNVVEVIDDKRIAVENPLEGDFEAELDGVSHEREQGIL